MAHFRRSAALFHHCLGRATTPTGDALTGREQDDHGQSVAELLAFFDDDGLVDAVRDVDSAGLDAGAAAAAAAGADLWRAFEASALDNEVGEAARVRR